MTLKKLLFLFALLYFILLGKVSSQSTVVAKGTYDVTIPHTKGVRTDELENIAPVVEKSISDGNYPGAVILVQHRGQMIYRGVFGYRRVLPDKAPMRFDTIFDLASLTKVIATTPAIMQLLEQGKLNLDSPVAQYWPSFGTHGKDKITIRELLTHESGLPADINPPHSKNAMYRQIEQLHVNAVDRKFIYSDINFIVLSHLVEIISGEPFDQYVEDHIFKPLRMNDTFFNPPSRFKDRIAPTDMSDGKLHWGQVQDPLANAMGGVSGNAGLFSDAGDLSHYADCLLDGGRITPSNKKDFYLLSPLSILKMTTPETPPEDANVRGLGWDIDSPYSNRGILLPVTSFGHTGWTGTSIWIDPTTQTVIIILTSRLHPKPSHINQLIEDRRLIANFVAASLTDISVYSENNTGFGELTRAYSKVGNF